MTIEAATPLLTTWATDTAQPEPGRLDAVVPRENLLAAVQSLIDARWGYLAAITGLDQGVEAGMFEVLYHFCSEAVVVTLRVPVPRDNARVPSVYAIIPSVSFYERELMEMFGIEVEGTPNSDRLFLPDDWPAGVYPLRKDFEMKDAGADHAG